MGQDAFFSLAFCADGKRLHRAICPKATCEGGFFYAAKDELSDSVIINQGMGKEQQAPRTVLVYRL